MDEARHRRLAAREPLVQPGPLTFRWESGATGPALFGLGVGAQGGEVSIVLRIITC